MNSRSIRVRIAFGAFFLVMGMLGLGCRLAFLHLGPHDQRRSDVEKKRTYERTILAGRGNVYDCRENRNILAMNLAVKNVCVDPVVVIGAGMEGDVASELSGALGVPEGEIAAIIKRRANKRFAYVKRFVMEEDALRIPVKKLPGVILEDTTIRYYPQSSFMCHVLGFVNHEGVGSAGSEQQFNSYLKGRPGLVGGAIDGKGHGVYSRRDSFVPAIRGADVCLTIDQNIQYIVEQVLSETVDEFKPKGAWAIVQRIRTGEILGMVNWPSYDPNTFRKASADDRMNRAISFAYEPGSTFKAATIAAAINEGVVTAETRIFCENGCWRFMKRDLHDHGRYQWLTVADGLKKSSNILTAKVALRLGRERFERCLGSFGFGHRLGIDLPGEGAGILHSYKKWSRISPTRIAIGQGVAVTGLQMLSVFSMIANDGFLMRPYVVSHVLDANGEILMKTEPTVLGRPITAETAAIMRRLLWRVTCDGGTGTRARIEGCKVAGKTGTAQKPVRGGYSDTAYVASFGGFVPADNPEIAVLVVVDEPSGSRYYGGQAAAPAFSRIAEQTLRYLDIPMNSGDLASLN